MKSVGEILKELGFNKEASVETQKAFFKHLAQMTDAKALKPSKNPRTKNHEAERQLEFNFSEAEPDKKRVS